MKKLLFATGAAVLTLCVTVPAQAQSISLGIGIGGPYLGARLTVPLFGHTPRAYRHMRPSRWSRYARPSVAFGLTVGRPYAYRYPYAYSYPPPAPAARPYTAYPPASAYPPPSTYPPAASANMGPYDDDAEVYDEEGVDDINAPAPRAPMRGPTGGVELRIPQRDAQVYVDGDFVGLVDEFNGAGRPLELPPGRHAIEVRQNGYGTLSFDVSVTANRTTTFRGELPRR